MFETGSVNLKSYVRTFQLLSLTEKKPFFLLENAQSNRFGRSV